MSLGFLVGETWKSISITVTPSHRYDGLDTPTPQGFPPGFSRKLLEEASRRNSVNYFIHAIPPGQAVSRRESHRYSLFPPGFPPLLDFVLKWPATMYMMQLKQCDSSLRSWVCCMLVARIMTWFNSTWHIVHWSCRLATCQIGRRTILADVRT